MRYVCSRNVHVPIPMINAASPLNITAYILVYSLWDWNMTILLDCLCLILGIIDILLLA